MRHASARAIPLVVVIAVSSTGCDRVFNLREVEYNPTNFYTCDCECSPNVSAFGAPLHTSAGGLFNAFAASDATGTVIDGPMDADFNGDTVAWFRVSVTGNLTGWTPAVFLAIAGTPPVFEKDPDVCLPQQFNRSLGGTDTPEITDLQNLCAFDVAPEASARMKERLSSSSFCACLANTLEVNANDASCGVACPGGLDLCLAASSDPPEPIPEPFSAAIFQPLTECAVEGQGTLVADGHTPKDQPAVGGMVRIHGEPCDDDTACHVAMSYQLESDDIEFDSGTIFADDPKFVDIALYGATEPDAILLAPFLAGFLGEVPANTTYSTAFGRRSGETEGFIVEGRNSEGMALAMNWDDGLCRVAGELVGQAAGDGEEGTVDATVDIALDGVVVNQPPRARAGNDAEVECTSTSGALVTLSAAGSTDADGNIALYEWRRGTGAGPQVAAPSTSPTLQLQQALGSAIYHLMVADTRTSVGFDTVQVDVVDTTGPSIDCGAPATITPVSFPGALQGSGITFTASSQDACTGVDDVRVNEVRCLRPASCLVEASGAQVVVRNSGGVGNAILWSVSSTDGAGNVTTSQCRVDVVKQAP